MTDGVVLHTRDADPGYVEQRLGRELYSHLRGMERITALRRTAVKRAFSMYEWAFNEGTDELKIGGLGLLVYQRTLLAVEDLGALLYALSGPSDERWLRFTSYGPADLDALFAQVVDGTVTVRELFSFPTDEAVAEEPDVSALQRQALIHLRDITESEIKPELDFTAGYWISRREPAKGLMHGWTVVAAPYLLDPPGAGVLSEQVDPETPRPFVLALVSEEDPVARNVHTESHVIDLRHEEVELVRHTADAACELLEVLATAWVGMSQSQHGFMIGSAYSDRLPPKEKEALEELHDAQA